MPSIHYLPDAEVDPELDLELRGLLSACFIQPHHAVFRERRYFKYPPGHRWLMREADALVAHAAVHERQIEVAGQVAPVGGVAEVCVLPAFRGRGLVRQLLAVVHRDLAERGVAFTALFGDPAVYGSSGYHMPGNVFLGPNADGQWEPAPRVLVHPLPGATWPVGEVHLPGPPF